MNSGCKVQVKKAPESHTAALRVTGVTHVQDQGQSPARGHRDQCQPSEFCREIVWSSHNEGGGTHARGLRRPVRIPDSRVTWPETRFMPTLSLSSLPCKMGLMRTAGRTARTTGSRTSHAHTRVPGAPPAGGPFRPHSGRRKKHSPRAGCYVCLGLFVL